MVRVLVSADEDVETRRTFLGEVAQSSYLLDDSLSFFLIETVDAGLDVREVKVVLESRAIRDAVIVLSSMSDGRGRQSKPTRCTLPVRRPPASAENTVVLRLYFLYSGLEEAYNLN